MGKPKGSPKTGGRVKGTPNASTRAMLNAIELAKEGETPLPYLLRIMRDENEPKDRRDWAAACAAPYVHPKLQAIEYKEPKKPSEAEEPQLDNLQLARMLALILRTARERAQDVTPRQVDCVLARMQ